MHSLAKYLSAGPQLNIGKFIKNPITLILILVISFAFVVFAFGNGVKNANSNYKIIADHEPFTYSGSVSNSANAPSKS